MTDVAITEFLASLGLRGPDAETARAILDAWLAVEAPDADELPNIERLAELDRR